jgi:ribonuclease BN (tRNA processing enzyme)
VEPLTIMGPPGTAGMLGSWERAVGTPFLDLHFDLLVEELRPGRRYALAPGAALVAHEARHSVESLSIRIEERGTRFGYTGDAAYAPELAAFFDGCDLLVADCSLETPSVEVRHMSVPELAELASRARVRRLVATHLFASVDPARARQRLLSALGVGVEVARDGLVVEI